MTIEQLEGFGVVALGDAEIDRVLLNRRVAVLALPDEGAPYPVALSYGFDGDSRLYFTYVGTDGRKRRLSEQAEAASVLVYGAETSFTWESVLLTGTLRAVPESRWDELGEALEGAWRPDLIARAADSLEVAVYAFEIETRSGFRHAGLPAGFDLGNGREGDAGGGREDDAGDGETTD